MLLRFGVVRLVLAFWLTALFRWWLVRRGFLGVGVCAWRLGEGGAML